jgi:hypothetical protein
LVEKKEESQRKEERREKKREGEKGVGAAARLRGKYFPNNP